MSFSFGSTGAGAGGGFSFGAQLQTQLLHLHLGPLQQVPQPPLVSALAALPLQHQLLPLALPQLLLQGAPSVLEHQQRQVLPLLQQQVQHLASAALQALVLEPQPPLLLLLLLEPQRPPSELLRPPLHLPLVGLVQQQHPRLLHQLLPQQVALEGLELRRQPQQQHLRQLSVGLELPQLLLRQPLRHSEALAQQLQPHPQHLQPQQLVLALEQQVEWLPMPPPRRPPDLVALEEQPPRKLRQRLQLLEVSEEEDLSPWELLSPQRLLSLQFNLSCPRLPKPPPLEVRQRQLQPRQLPL